MAKIVGFCQATAEGNRFTIVACNGKWLVVLIHPKAMITILGAEDCDTWLRGSYDEVVALQRPYEAAAMTVRGPVFPTREAAVKSATLQAQPASIRRGELGVVPQTES